MGGGSVAPKASRHSQTESSVRVRRLARLGLLIAIAMTLSLLERQLPPPAPVPGVRWGLANAVTLAALALEGPGAAFMVWALRFLLVSMLTGSLFGPAFVVGGAGGLLAWAAMAALSRQRWLGAPGVSIAGALFHHAGQVAGAAVVTAAPGVFLLLPPLLLLAVPVGLITGTLVGLLLRRLRSAGLAGYGACSWLEGPRSLRAADLLLASAAGLVALGLTGWASQAPADTAAPTRAVISVAGSQVLTIDLRQDGIYPLDLDEGHMVVEVLDGAVRVRASDCPDQICVLTGWIRNPGEMIVCVPFRVVVQIPQASHGGGPDAILR